MKFHILKLSLVVLGIVLEKFNSTETENGIYGKFKMSVLKAKNSVKASIKKEKLTPPSVTLADIAGPLLQKQATGILDTSNPTIDLGSPPYFHGWLQYFKYSSDLGLTKPGSFYKNNEFYKQQKSNPTTDFSKKDNQEEYEWIPKETFFYGTLFDKTFNIANSKKDQFTQNFDVINIATIKPVTEESAYKGGIEEFGNFKEGYCFKVKTESGESFVWILCFQDRQNKKKLMLAMKRLKLKEQRKEGKIVTSADASAEKPLDNFLNPELDQVQKRMDKENAPKDAKDGYWVVISEWSQCSLKCGRGETVLQRMCVPPKGDGKPCIGESIVKAPCNTQPCPIVSKMTGAVANTNSTEYMEPTVKVMTFSDRPQRYTKCIIKESDLLYSVMLDDEDAKNHKMSTLTIPARVVMNNKTISIFGGESYDSLKDSYDIQKTVFVPSASHENCFLLRDDTKKAQFCFFGSENTKDSYSQWDYDFNLFKYQCKTPKEKYDLTKEEMEEINNSVKDKKKEMLMDRELQMVSRQKEEEINDKEEEVGKANKIALMAVQKQIKMEALLEKEEQERENYEEENLRKEIETEKKKEECAMKKIKEREIENQYNIRAEEAEEESKEVQAQAAQEVMIYRNKLKDKLKLMRKSSERKKEKMRSELKDLRMKFGGAVQSAYRKGSTDNCLPVLTSKENYSFYCKRMHPSDPELYGRCNTADNPCIACCEQEFNDMFISDRMKCQKDICQKNPKIKGGRWVWENDVI